MKHGQCARCVELARERDEMWLALQNLCDEIGNKELHGDGAHDDGCSICRAHKRARKVLATAGMTK